MLLLGPLDPCIPYHPHHRRHFLLVPVYLVDPVGLCILHLLDPYHHLLHLLDRLLHLYRCIQLDPWFQWFQWFQ